MTCIDYEIPQPDTTLDQKIIEHAPTGENLPPTSPRIYNYNPSPIRTGTLRQLYEEDATTQRNLPELYVRDEVK